MPENRISLNDAVIRQYAELIVKRDPTCPTLTAAIRTALIEKAERMGADEAARKQARKAKAEAQR